MIRPIEKFPTAEEAWFWFIRCERARAEGAWRADRGSALTERPCEPADIMRGLRELYADDTLLPSHLFILGLYGELERPPNPDEDTELVDWVIWVDAFDYFEVVLRDKGIIE